MDNATLTTEAPRGPLSFRAELENHIERLIALLDSIDGDPDLEPSIIGGRDPVTGKPILDDREGGDVSDEGEPHDWDDEEGGDLEPSMGWGHGAHGRPLPLDWTYDLLSGAGADGDE